jgi:hypothetical protein
LVIELAPEYRKSHDWLRFSNLGKILREREHKLNFYFEWTDENQKKLLAVNEMFLNAWEKTLAETKSIMCTLENQIADKNDFLTDYEIRIKIIPYLLSDKDDIDDSETVFDELLSEEFIEECYLSEHFSHCHFERYKDSDSRYIDRSFNWNLEYFDHIFDRHYIGLSIHQLLDTHIWSFYDILRINRIWSDINVTYQSEMYLKNDRGVINYVKE